MTLDFRFAIDWNDNGYINWFQTASSEDDPLNFRQNALIGDKTVLNGSVVDSANNYGLDYVLATAPGSAAINLGKNAGIGEYTLAGGVTYTCTMWVRKTGGSDSGKTVRLFVRETTASSSTILQSTFSDAVDIPTYWYKMSVTFTTHASTERVYLQVYSSTSGWTNSYRCSGLMFTGGSTVPGTFNDGVIKVLTHRVIKADWNVGYKTSIVRGSVADENRLECVLDNYDDYIGESKYSDVHRVYIEGSDDGSTWTRLYTGWTNKWFPSFDSNGDGRLRFQGVSSRFYLDGINARLAVQESVYQDDVILAILAATELPDSSSISSFRAGDYLNHVYGYVGHTWTEDVDLLRALSDVMGGGGYCGYFGRDDEFYGFNINGIQNTAASSDVTLNGFIPKSADFRYADPWFNRIEMKVSPRKLSSTNTKQLWRLPEDYDVIAGSVQETLVRFNDEDKPYQIGARDLSYTSLTATPGTSNLTITITERSTSAYIEWDASARVTDTTITDFILQGQKIKSWDSYFEILEFDTEINSNGNNTLSLNYDLPDDIDTATNIMEYWLAIYGEKHHRLWSATSPMGRQDSDLLDYTVENVASIAYPDGSTYKHVIIGEAWRFKGGGFFEKTWYLERIYDSANTPVKPTP